MAWVVGFNTSFSPVVIDDAGHTLGGGEWGAVDDEAPEVIDAAREGTLQLYPVLEGGEGQNPDALAAIERVAELRAQAQSAADDKTKAAAAAAEDDTKAEDEAPTKPAAAKRSRPRS